MLCPNCGNEIFEADLFCRKCGTKITEESNVIVPVNNNQIATRTEKLLQKALPVFEQFEGYYNQLENVLQEYEQKKTSYKQMCHEKAKYWRTVFYVSFFVVAGILFSLVGINMYLLIPASIIAGVGLFLGLYIPPRYEAKQEELDKMEEEKQTEADIVRSNFQQALKNNAEIVAEIPKDYRTYYAVSYFYNQVVNGKADTLRECMLQYDNYLHQMRMEQNQMEMFSRLEAQERVLDAIAENSREAARRADDAAWFSAMSMLL